MPATRLGYDLFLTAVTTRWEIFLFSRSIVPTPVSKPCRLQAGRAHFIGSYCKRDFPLIGCVKEADVYCVFNSKLGRIAQEQGRLQLKQFAPGGNWGSAGSPNCDGFTPEEFQMLDFSQIDLSEMFGDLSPLSAETVQGKVRNAVNAFQERVQ